MLVPYIILQAQNEGVKKLVVIDRDTWTQKQWNDYTVSTLNMSYYLWNATNLDAVMRDTTGGTFIKWQEVGPFNIAKISHMEPLSGESASSGSPYLRYRKLTTYKIRDEATKQLLSKPIVAINSLWVGALSRAAQSLYAGSVQANTQLTDQQKFQAIRANLYPQAFNKESLFYGALTQGWLSGAAVQFTALNATGYTPESALIPALRILSIGEYLLGALSVLSGDVDVRSSLNITVADETLAVAAAQSKLVAEWGRGQSNRTQTIALRAVPFSPTLTPAKSLVRMFQDFELPAAINATSISKIWDRQAIGPTSVALVNIVGLRNWGVALQCVPRAGVGCTPQQTQAYQLMIREFGTRDFMTIVAWLAPLLDTANTIKPDWRRTYTQHPIITNTYVYIATSPAERFQQIIVAGFQQKIGTLYTNVVNNTQLAQYAFQLTQYPFAPSSITVVDGSEVEPKKQQAATQIQTFYDLALLQYSTGWVVSLALPGLPLVAQLRGVTVSQANVLGASAGFGGQLNIENEPIEFSAAVQLVDPTIPIQDSRLTVQQAKALLEFIQGRATNMSATTVVTPACIGFTLVSEAAIRVSQATLVRFITEANNTVIANLLAPYLQLRTSAVFEGIEKIPLPYRMKPELTLPGIWNRAISEVNNTAGASFLPAVRAFIAYSGINETSGAGIRPFVAYFHSYFRRLQGGVGPIEALYSIPGNAASTASVDNEVYNPVFGVSRRTNGLFIQRTGFEFLFGGRSHLPNTELNPILSPTTSYLDENYREYDGGAIRDGAIPTPGANPIMLSTVYNIPYERNTLDEAKQRNRIVFQGQETAINTGRMDINAVGQYHLYNGFARYNSICQYNNPGRVPEIKADSSFRIPGETLRSACVEGSPADYSIYDNGFIEEIGDRVNDPGQFQPFREGDSKLVPVIGTYITEVARTVTFNYTGVVTIKGINLRRYQLDSKYLFRYDAPNNPFKNQNYRQIEKPGFYPETPDGMVSGWYLLGAPIYVSKPHFYQVSPQVSSAFAPGSFNPQTHLHETYLDVDALSGKTMHARKRLQANIYVSRDTIDASPHLEPIFASGDKYFPYYWAQEAGTITDEDADSFKTNIYKARDIGKIVQIVVGVFSAIFFVISVALVVRSCTKTPDATTTDK